MQSGNRLFLGPLMSDPVVATALSPASMIVSFLDFEMALTRAQGNGLAADQMIGFVADMAAIEEATARDGLPVPEFVRQLKSFVGPDAAKHTHIATTSQDLMDTSTAIALKTVNAIFLERLQSLIGLFDDLLATHGDLRMMGRTRMQAALEIRVADRIQIWADPLRDLKERLKAIRPAVEVLHLSGPVGDKRNLPDQVIQSTASQLGLDVTHVRTHTNRITLTDYASWLSLLTGHLGKIAQDLALMAQQGIDEVSFATTGGSSAMPHKQNPVLAEVLVAIARFNASQLSGFHQALVHEQERSGASWTLEWMILPQMVGATGAGLLRAEALLGSITHLGVKQSR